MEKTTTGDLELAPDAYDDPDQDEEPTQRVKGSYREVTTQDPEATS